MYRFVDGIQLPFKVSPIVKEHGRSRLEVPSVADLQRHIRKRSTNSKQVNIKLKAQFDPTLFALNVIVKIPLPSNTG